ncbi:CPBP family intramembrane glutamic endopeptidase [Alteromonas gracilis]|uniref:CPBP family intramembrane glutamic endopeptidase n=1 Tax=Alteromonas gracilis TaxID=1479524 RepID=UPI0037352BAA
MLFNLQVALLLILLTWLFIYLSEKRNVFKQWGMPFKQRCKQFIAGFIAIGGLSLLSQAFFTFMFEIHWTISEYATFGKLLHSSALDFISVLIEELVFRGVLLYFLMKYVGSIKALAISAVAFGIYHWFTFNVLGNAVGMALVFISTGFIGYAFAVAFVKTKSVILPIALHFGCNWVNNSLFSNGPNGTGLFIPHRFAPEDTSFYIVSFIWYLLVPLLILLFLKSGALRNFALQSKCS